MSRLCHAVCAVSLLSLVGCHFSGPVSAGPTTANVGPLQGSVYGGQQPIAGAHVYLFATGTGGVAGKDIAGSPANASVSLLNSSGNNTVSDGTNYYVLTDANGGFTITGDYTCMSGTQLYLYTVGGNPGAGTNSSAGLLAGVGACPAGASTLPASAFYNMNEVTTAATAYALAAFATDPLHISANESTPGSTASQLAATGIANAMANVGNLVDLASGRALSMTPGGNGTVPAAELNTLGNILATCVNTADAAPGNCAALFAAAKSDGSTGSTPTDTAAAAINIVHNATQNVGALFGLQEPTSPFAGLSSQPNDFSIAITFAGGGASSPKSVAVDASGNVWGVSSAGVVNAYSPTGVPLSPAGFTSATTANLNALAIDGDGNIWVQDVNGIYTEFGPTGTVLSTNGGYSGGNAGSSALTTDSFGYFWSANASDGTVFRFDPLGDLSVANYTVGVGSLMQADSAGFIWLAAANGTLYKLNETGTTVANYPGLYTTGSAMTVDGSNAVYVADASTKVLDKVSSDGTQTSFADGVNGAQALAIDGANNIWSANSKIAEISSSGTNLLATDLQLPGASTSSLAVDGSGNLWVADTSESGSAGSHYTEFIGVAIPMLTPSSYVATHGTLQNVRNLTIGFNGPKVQFPYMDQYYAAQNSYYQSIGSSYPTGARYCHAYLSWDIAEQAKASGPVGTEGSRAWFEDWLTNAVGHCDRALVTFKYISGITVADSGTYPSASDYETAMTTFLSTDWTYTGWNGVFDYTAWNEPQNGAASGDGLTLQIPPQSAADYYLALRKHCLPANGCTVAAGDFGSNGQLYSTYIQNCADDSAALCSGYSYMDAYKHYILADEVSYGFVSAFRPEVFAYHGWDDINNYINTSTNHNHCLDPQRCTVRALVTSLTDGAWTNSVIWDTEVAAGQNPQSNPDPITQACAASFLLDLTGSVSSRITRIYWTQPYVAAGNYFSMFDGTSAHAPKPAFYVMTARNIAYLAPSGSTCP